MRSATPDLPQWIQQHRWDIGQRLRHLRLDAGLSQVELGRRTGLDHKTLSRYENGHRNLGIDELALLAHALGVPSALLLPTERPPGPAGG